MSANAREARIAMGFKYQSAVQTANIAAEVISLNKMNDATCNVELVTEDDANWLGKGHEFATQNFQSYWNTSVALEKFNTSQGLALLWAFGLGKATKATPTTGAYAYTCVPQDPVTDGIDMKCFTYVEAIRQGANKVYDRALIGSVYEDFTVSCLSGPGLANSKFTANIQGCGKVTDPSTITIPSITTESIMSQGSVGLTVNGVDYVTSHNLVSVELGWKNNCRMDSGFYPGSGTQVAADGSTGAIRGRMEFGNRTPTLRFSARFDKDSLELTRLLDQTAPGGETAVFTLQGGVIASTTHHALSVTFQKVRFKSAVVGNQDGIVTVNCEMVPLYHSSNGLITVIATTDIDSILVAAA